MDGAEEDAEKELEELRKLRSSTRDIISGLNKLLDRADKAGIKMSDALKVELSGLKDSGTAGKLDLLDKKDVMDVYGGYIETAGKVKNELIAPAVQKFYSVFDPTSHLKTLRNGIDTMLNKFGMGIPIFDIRLCLQRYFSGLNERAEESFSGTRDKFFESEIGPGGSVITDNVKKIVEPYIHVMNGELTSLHETVYLLISSFYSLAVRGGKQLFPLDCSFGKTNDNFILNGRDVLPPRPELKFFEDLAVVKGNRFPIVVFDDRANVQALRAAKETTLKSILAESVKFQEINFLDMYAESLALLNRIVPDIDKAFSWLEEFQCKYHFLQDDCKDFCDRFNI